MSIKKSLKAVRTLYKRYEREQFLARATVSAMMTEGYTDAEIAIVLEDTPCRGYGKATMCFCNPPLMV